jgi:transitional endoplasmic reticulum ATPase
MDGVEELTGVSVIAATNRVDIVDPALLRSGRFDLFLSIPFPDENALVEILKIHTRSKPLASDVNLKELSREIKGFSGADVELLCQRASLIAIRKHLKKGKGILKITRNHFEEALNEMAKINGFIFPKHSDPGRTSGTHQSA